MTITDTIERVVIVPRNGYVNRLQAWASAAILAAELDAPLEMHWEPEPIAPARAEDLFDITRLSTTLIDEAATTAITGQPHAVLPRYLTVDTERQCIVLAGHDLGEQHFMASLSAMLREYRARSLVIIAGGKFALPGSNTFDRQRQIFYDRIAWQADIASAVADARQRHATYLGLHIRQTDRSLEAPTQRSIRRALEQLRDRNVTRSLFVCADTENGRDSWAAIARGLGMDPWSAQATDFDRGMVQAGRDAMVDWILLGKAQASVFSAASSFAQEAAVASGRASDCLSLTASDGLQAFRRSTTWVRAGAHRVRRMTHRDG